MRMLTLESVTLDIQLTAFGCADTADLAQTAHAFSTLSQKDGAFELIHRWERISAPATECPRIVPKFLERERRNMAPMWFRQEYLAEFVDNGTSVFARDLIEAAIDPTIKPLMATLKLHTHS